MVSDNPLAELQSWYFSNCNGHWEHQHGLKIDTLDNPGWVIAIDLAETKLENRPFTEIHNQIEHDLDWYICEVKNQKFIGHCGPKRLEEVVNIFLNWAT